MREVYFFHFKNFRGNTDQIVSAVTGAYCFDLQNGIVKLGGAIFKKSAPSDHWNRKIHCATALHRMQQHPICLKFAEQISIDNWHFYNYRRLERTLRLAFWKFGVCDKSSGPVSIEADKCSCQSTVILQKIQDDNSDSDDSFDDHDNSDGIGYYDIQKTTTKTKAQSTIHDMCKRRWIAIASPLMTAHESRVSDNIVCRLRATPIEEYDNIPLSVHCLSAVVWATILGYLWFIVFNLIRFLTVVFNLLRISSFPNSGIR